MFLCCRQTQFAQERDKRLAADEVVRELRQQREHMNAELFGMKTEIKILKDENKQLQQQKQSLLEVSENETAQQEVKVSHDRIQSDCISLISDPFGLNE